MNNHILYNLDIIRKIALFKGLEDDILEKILQNAQVNNYEKGKNLFSFDEKILNFYIILEGSLKMFLLDQDGLETVLYLAESGESVCNIFDKYFQANGQLIENSLVLKIPISHLQELVKNYLHLATNFLNDSEAKNRKLFKQVTQLKISDAKEKVGNFLLEKSLTKGQKAKNINLNASKATIASFLGIKPETLSRIFKKLIKDKEILVEKNAVKLLKEDSLCQYCDLGIAKKCHHNKEPFCKY